MAAETPRFSGAAFSSTRFAPLPQEAWRCGLPARCGMPSFAFRSQVEPPPSAHPTPPDAIPSFALSFINDARNGCTMMHPILEDT